MYYWSKLYASQMQEGMPYSKLQKAITINVLDCILFPIHDGFQTTGTLWDIEKEVLVSEDIEIHHIELPKLIAQWRNEQVNPWHDALVRWLLLLTAHEDQNLTETLEAIAMEHDETLQKAMNKWDNMSHNQTFRREYEAREKILLDEKAVVAHAKAVGREEGIEKGIAQLVRNMSNRGTTPEEIAALTGLEVTEVQCILQLS